MSDYGDDEYSDNDESYYYDYPIIYDNYDKLMKLTKHDKTDDKLRDIVIGLIKASTIVKKKEVGFNYDYNIAPRTEWLKIAQEFNSNVCGSDYRILIDESCIICYVVNEDLIK